MTNNDDESASISYIDFVIDGPPSGPEGGRFVEVEDAEGRSVKVGEWIRRDDGNWALRFPCPKWATEV